MAFDGNGNFIRIHNWQQDAANAIDISAPEMDGEDNGFAAGLTNCVTRDGQGKMGADFTPNADNVLNLGTALRRWANLNGIPIANLPITQAAMGVIFYPQSPAEAAAVVVPVNYFYPYGHVYRYATNVTPGTTDMTVAFQNASIVSLNPYAPADTYKITGTVQIRANQHWKFDRAIVNITGGVVVPFNVAEGINDWSIAGSLVIVGDGPNDGSGGGAATGLWITDSMRYRVEGFTAKNIKGWGILVSPGLNAASEAETGEIVAPQFFACSIGMECTAGAGAEYVNISTPRTTRCGIGMKLGAGNVNVAGGSATANAIGLFIDQGPNSAHGVITGMSINHNTTYGVQTNQVVNGQTFTGCHFYQNNLFFDRSKGIFLDGGVIDCGVYNFKAAGSGVNCIRNMYCPGNYGFIRQAGSNNGHDQLMILDCWGPGIAASAGDALDPIGVCMNDVSQCHLYYDQLAGVTQALTSGVATDLLVTNKVYDHRLAYNTGTGVATIPTDKFGLYRVKASLLFGGTAMSVTGSFVELKVNGTTTRICLAEIFSNTKLRVFVDEEIYLNAADAVKLTATIVGTTPSFGDATWQSSFSVEKIA